MPNTDFDHKNLKPIIEEIEVNETQELNLNDDDMLPWSEWLSLSQAQRDSIREHYSAETADLEDAPNKTSDLKD